MIVGRILSDLTNVYLLLLFVRAVFDFVVSVNRDFRPTGAFAGFLEIVFTTTDPPLKLLRRLIPPLRVGNAAIDLGFFVLFIGLVIIKQTVFSRI